MAIEECVFYSNGNWQMDIPNRVVAKIDADSHYIYDAYDNVIANYQKVSYSKYNIYAGYSQSQLLGQYDDSDGDVCAYEPNVKICCLWRGTIKSGIYVTNDYETCQNCIAICLLSLGDVAAAACLLTGVLQAGDLRTTAAQPQPAAKADMHWGRFFVIFFIAMGIDMIVDFIYCGRVSVILAAIVGAVAAFAISVFLDEKRK